MRLPKQLSVFRTYNTPLQSWKPQMDDSNREIMNMMIHESTTIFNSVIENSAAIYQVLATQMGRLADVLGVPDDGTKHCKQR
jgi:hypothetical protein